MSKRFYNKCLKAARLGREHATAQHDLNDAFESRYGIGYNDTDDCRLIDSFDYAGHCQSLKEIDKIMAENGYPAKEPSHD